MNAPVKTTCPYCGVGCGVIATLDDEGGLSVKGDRDHPANYGRLCSKGAALAETVHLEERLLYPEVHGEQVSWDQALGTVAGEFSKAIEQHGPDSVAFYVSGQILTEDYYVANKLMKGCIGSANIDTNSRLCMASPVAAYKRAFGEDCVPVNYEDLEIADLVVIVGSNTAWCHPVVYQRLVKAKKKRPEMRIVLIDPRRTQTADIADLHLPIKPGTDAYLWNGLLVALDETGQQDERFVKQHTTGGGATLIAAQKSAGDAQTVANACGLQLKDVKRFFDWFTATRRTVTLYSQGVNQSASGTDKCNAIINCHLYSGRIGQPGMGPFSITGQPNAMGGREVGGLANQLAAHMNIDNEDHRDLVQRFWGSPHIPKKEGLKAVDLFDAIERGQIKAVWIMATNPVVSLPNAEKVRHALKHCNFSVVSDCIGSTDTVKLCDVRLPALTWGERDGTVTNSERCISRQRPFMSAPGIARPDWWIIGQVARRMGFGELFPYESPAEIFRAHAALSAFENDGSRLFDLGAFSMIDRKRYDALEPVQWPAPKGRPEGSKYIYEDGRFTTPNGKARLLPVRPQHNKTRPSESHPFTLNTGRVRDHWHTLSRTGLSPRLSQHKFEPYVEVHPQDAARLGLRHGELARLASPLAEAVMRVEVSDQQQRGSLFAPMHWSDAFASKARICALIDPHCDPVSGQPESKGSAVSLQRYRSKWHGFILSRRPIDTAPLTYWTRARGRGLWRYEIAGEFPVNQWNDMARHLLGSPEADNWMDYYDGGARQYRGARFLGDRLDGCIFIGPDEKLPPRDWLIGLFARDKLAHLERAALLSGQPPSGAEDQGSTVCSCFNVGEKAILKAIDEGCESAQEISARLKAGTNCGSCLPEIKQLIAARQKVGTEA